MKFQFPKETREYAKKHGLGLLGVHCDWIEYEAQFACPLPAETVAKFATFMAVLSKTKNPQEAFNKAFVAPVAEVKKKPAKKKAKARLQKC